MSPKPIRLGVISSVPFVHFSGSSCCLLRYRHSVFPLEVALFSMRLLTSLAFSFQIYMRWLVSTVFITLENSSGNLTTSWIGEERFEFSVGLNRVKYNKC